MTERQCVSAAPAMAADERMRFLAPAVSLRRLQTCLRESLPMDVVALGVFARAWAVQPSKVAWLLGAGSSASAGVPTAARIIDDLLLRMYADEFGMVRQSLDAGDPAVMSRVRRHYDGANGMPPSGSSSEYSDVFAAVMPDGGTRRAYLREFLSGRRPSYGQRVLGAALATGGTDLVLTTNFDELIEAAAADARVAAAETGERRLLSVAALDSAPRAAVAAANDDWPLLVKLHGDFREAPLKNLAVELQEQDATLRQAVVDSSRRFGLAVAGYSGRDSSVMSMLEEATGTPGAWPAGLWWLTREPERLPDSVTSLLSEAAARGVTAHAVRAENFDEAMAALAGQAQFEPAVRVYVDGLRPRGIVGDAPPPTGRSSAFPVLRLNALAVVEAPGRVLRAEVEPGLTSETLGERLRAGGWRGAAVLSSGAVLALGRESELARCLDASMVSRVEVDPLSENAPADVLALASEALVRGLARRLPARPSVRDRGSHLRVVPPRKDEAEHVRAARVALEGGYDGRLTGTLPAGMGKTEHGRPRAFAEAIRVRLERADGKLWMLFVPFTWTEESEAMAAARRGGDARPVDPAADWKRERWVKRKRNERWAAIVGGWAQALAPDRPATRVPVLTEAAEKESDAEGGSFLLSYVTAYSRPTS